MNFKVTSIPQATSFKITGTPQTQANPLDGFSTLDTHQQAMKTIQAEPNPLGKVVLSVGEAARQTNEALNAPWSPIGWVTGLIGGAAHVLGSGVEAVDSLVAPKIGEALRGLVGAENADKVGQGIVNAVNSPLSQAAVKSFGPGSNTANALGAVANVANLAGTVAGTKTAVEALPELGTLAPKPQAPASVVGKITQASPAEIPAASRALTSVDTSGVKTFADLSSRLESAIKENTAKVDTELGKNTQRYKPSTLTNEPVKQALDQLENFYRATNDTKALGKITDLQERYQTKGLTAKEMNDIAREHGRELNGYNANGELASGLSKQAAENTRQGVKQAVRNLTPSGQTETIDANTADLIRTKDLVDEMHVKVQQLENKLKHYNAFQKLGKFAAKGFDIFTGGVVKAFLRQLLGIGTEQGTRMNPLELQDMLQKNLQLLNKLNTMNPEEVVQTIGNNIPQ